MTNMTKEQLLAASARFAPGSRMATDPACPDCKWQVCQCPPSKVAVYLARGFFIAAAIFAFALAGWSLSLCMGKWW